MDATGLPGAGPGLVLSMAEPLYPLATLSALVGEPVHEHNKLLMAILGLKGGVHGSAHVHESKYFFAFARYDPSLFNLIRCL